ncbi:MAG: hypothetical protein AAF690_21210 [Acidobacteriota bacterium]
MLSLAYVSPLPPVRSGISDYSVDLLDGLTETQPELDLVVVRVPGQEVSEPLRERLRPIDVEALSDSEHERRCPWYQMGNNPYHAEIGAMAHERPGVLTLHDVWLHHLLVEQTLARGDTATYVDRLTQEHGWVGGAVALPPRWSGYSQSSLFALPAHRTLLDAQRGVLVHSRWAARVLGEEGIRTPVTVVPMPMPAPPIDEAARRAGAAVREQLGVGTDALLLGSFGFQTPIKRTSSVVRCLAEEGMEDVHLLVAGEASPAVDLAGLARDLGVTERVHEVGFLSEDEFQASIEACDLSVNLRYPTAGETSASLLRTFARGRAAVVSDYAQFADFDRAVAVRIPVASPEEEGASLAALLRPLRSDRSKVIEMGAAARRLILEQHDPQRAVALMLEAIAGFADAPRGPGPERCRPTTLTYASVPSALEVTGLEGWRAGERREIEIVLHNRGFATWLPASAGPGGVAVEVQLLGDDGRDLRAGESWLPLPRAVAPGERCSLRLRLRKPTQPSRLRIEPQISEGASFSALDGDSWESAI